METVKIETYDSKRNYSKHPCAHKLGFILLYL